MERFHIVLVYLDRNIITFFFAKTGALSGRSTSIGSGHDCTKTLDEKFNDFSKLSRQGSLENFDDYSKLSRQGSLGKFHQVNRI